MTVLEKAVAGLDWPGRTKPEQARARVTAKRAARAAYPVAPHFQAAFVKGWHARLVGKSRDDNPYRGATHGKRRNGTFTFAWRAAWTRGYDEAHR